MNTASDVSVRGRLRSSDGRAKETGRALHGRRAFQGRGRARDLSSRTRQREDDAGGPGVRLQLGRCRVQDLLSAHADRRCVTLTCVDERLEGSDRVRGRASVHVGGGSAGHRAAVVALYSHFEILTRVTALTKLLARTKLPSRVTEVLRTMSPPPGIAQLCNFEILGSKRTKVFSIDPDSQYQMTSLIAEMPKGSDFGPLVDCHSVTLQIAESRRPR